jgi:tetratricopeptide (TPR) repeat protein
MPPVKVEGMDEGQIKGVYTAVRAAAETSPNLPYVAAYWKAVKQFDTRQVEAGVQDLLRNQSARLANLDVSNASDAQRLANLVPALNIKPEELEQLFPYEVASLIGLGNLYLSMETRKAYLDAERVLSEAIKLDNNNAPAYAARGLAYFKQGKPAEALKDLEQAQKLDPKYPWTFNNRSLVYAAQREWKKVIAELDQAIALNPTLPIAFLNRGLAHRNDGNLPKASIDLGRAIELAQATGELEILESAYTQLGDLLLEQRSFSEAIDACNRVVRLDRANPLGYLKLGQAYLLASSFQAAVFNLATAADIYENQPGQHDHENLAACYSALAQAYLRLDEPVDVLANVERAAALGDQRPANFKLKGLAHIKLLEEDKAIQALRVYLELLPTAPDRESVQALINDLERKQARSLEKGA